MSEQNDESLSAVAWCLVALTFGALGCAGGWFARDYQARHEKAENRVTLAYVATDWYRLLVSLRELETGSVALVGYAGDDGDVHALAESDLWKDGQSHIASELTLGSDRSQTCQVVYDPSEFRLKQTYRPSVTRIAAPRDWCGWLTGSRPTP